MQKLQNQILTFLLVMVLASTMLLSTPSAMAAETATPGYRVSGTYDAGSNRLTVDIFIHDVSASAGRLALGFDPEKLELVGGNSLFETVKAGQRVAITTEGWPASRLISQKDGYVMFAWNPDSSKIDATAAEYKIATIGFTLKEDVTTDSFDSQTLYMRYIGGNSVEWDSGAWIRGAGLVDFKNAVAGVSDCSVNFEYPSSDIEPSSAQDVTVKITDTSGTAIPGSAVLGTNRGEGSGAVNFRVVNGNYYCRVNALGYEEKIITVKVSGDTSTTVELRSTSQLVNAVASALEITFSEGDSAEHVTRDMGFSGTGEQNTSLTWKSDKPLVVNEYGNVFRTNDEEAVTVTVTVSKDGHTAQKQFSLLVTAKDVIPPSITPPDEGGGDETKNPFTDIGSVPWAQEGILALTKAGVIQGTSKTTFSPNNSITRGDFTALLMRMFKPQNGDAVNDFSDVSVGDYYYSEIMLARSLGIAEGEGDNRFYPRASITRQDMMTLTYRTLEKLGYLSIPGNPSILDDFSDGASVAAYARVAVANLVQSGYIVGDSGFLMPLKNATRAEAAVFLYKVSASIRI